MGMGFYKAMGPAIIPSGNNVSNSISEHTDCAAVAILAPAALDAHTYIIQVSNDSVDTTDANSTWVTYQEGATLVNVTLPAAGLGAVYQLLACFRKFRIKDSSGNAASARSWGISGCFTT